MNEDKIKKYIELVGGLIDAHISSPRKEKIEFMLEKLGDLYFTSPASSKKQFHNAFPGGLVAHSINVYKNLLKLNKTFKCGFSEESMLICALFHDFGKCATTDLTPHYVSAEDWKRKNGTIYEPSPDGDYSPNHVRSIFLLQKFGVELQSDEFLAIYLNDGPILEGNRSFCMKEPKLAVFLHMADRLSCLFEQEETKAKD